MLRWTDRLYPDGTWEANLFQFFYRTYGKLAQLLPTPFMLKGTDRQEETSAHVALREALANCLIHCNYAQQGNILVVGRRNEITMRNPGCMLISVADFYAGSRSICRNPLLQKLFMFLGNGEKAGSGADIIKKGWADNKWQQPMLSERVQPDECLMTLALSGAEEDVGKEQNDTKDGIKDGTKELSDRQLLILNMIKLDDTIKTHDLTQKTGMSQRTLMRELAALQERGILTREGGRKEGRWVIKQAAN